QVEFASEHWFRLAAATLASMTRSAGLATPAKPRSAHIRRVDLVVVNERMASLILVLREGAIKQAAVTLDDGDDTDQATLNQVSGLLNERLTGLDANHASTMLARLSDDVQLERVARRVGERIVRILREYDAATIDDVFSDGLLNVMEAPEFAQSDKLRRVFTALENRVYLGELVGNVADAGRIQIYIGGENEPDEMHGVSLVLAPYGRPGHAIGVVGVLGPTRMSYPQAIGTVRFVSSLMNELVDHLYA
ncbi:MAG TPA: HrcA family transcriptional regulator, partial [Candidatus Saccharimonadales bacterium]|nr:HrcA family transcriptional regulator [Candidatus Saccharimonadales bacterium]